MPLFQNESKCETFHFENEFCMQFHIHGNQSHVHENPFALRLALKQRHKGTRKWPFTVVWCPSLSRKTVQSFSITPQSFTRVVFVIHTSSWMVRRRWEKTQPIMAD